GGNHVRRGELQDAGPVNVRRPLHVAGLGHVHNAAHLGDPAGAGDVGLDDVHAAAVQQVAELPASGQLLAGGDAGVHRVGQPGVAVEVVGRQRLLDPVRAVALEEAHALDRLGGVPDQPDIEHHVHV